MDLMAELDELDFSGLSGSDLDEDPDSMEVPGSGIDFSIASNILNNNNSDFGKENQNNNTFLDFNPADIIDELLAEPKVEIDQEIIQPQVQSNENVSLPPNIPKSTSPKTIIGPKKQVTLNWKGKKMEAYEISQETLESMGLSLTEIKSKLNKTSTTTNKDTSPAAEKPTMIPQGLLNPGAPTNITILKMNPVTQELTQQKELPQIVIDKKVLRVQPSIPNNNSNQMLNAPPRPQIVFDKQVLRVQPSIPNNNFNQRLNAPPRLPFMNGVVATRNLTLSAASSSNNSTSVRYVMQPKKPTAHPGVPQFRINGTQNSPKPTLVNVAVPNRNQTFTIANSSNGSTPVNFTIGPNSQLLRNMRPVPQIKMSSNGLTMVKRQLPPTNRGDDLTRGLDLQNLTKEEFMSRMRKNFSSQGIDNPSLFKFIEKNFDPNLGKRRLEGLDNNYFDSSQSPKRSRVCLEEVDNEMELGVAETYSTYMPSKLKLGCKHPDPVVETASLSSVAPVDVWYGLSIPEDVIENGALSALQLESITYAAQAHEQILPNGMRAGFLIGDGAGVGKGRTIAGIILENYRKGRERAVWVSISNDLKYDAERDLQDIGAGHIKVHQLNKIKYNAKISSDVNGSIKKGVLFCTYSSLIGESQGTKGKYINRKNQILQWCRQDFDGLLIFDECHKAKNLCPNGSMKSTKTGQIVLDLQDHMPKARVLYASATGASEPKNMAYMARLGLWGEGTTFKTFEDFTTAVEGKGVGGMEIVAMDMKLRGMYIARQLSFQDVKFTIKEVPLSDEFVKIYNASVKLWTDALDKFTKAASLVAASNSMKKTMWGQFWSAHQRYFKYLCIAAKVNDAVKLAHNAMKYANCCVVIGLQSTGESGTLDQLERNDGELSDFVSTAKGVFQNLVERHFPSSNRDNVQKILSNISASKQTNNKPKNGVLKLINEREILRRKQRELLRSSDDESSDGMNFDDDGNESDASNSSEKERLRRQKESEEEREKTNNMLNFIFKNNKPKNFGASKKEEKKVDEPKLPSSHEIEEANEMKESLLRKIEVLGKKLPKNTLDELIDNLGGPEEVAEMTGRKGRVVQTDNGVQYQTRSEQDAPLEMLNVKEKERFMNGEKYVAIISEAASSGISLQSDRRAVNKKKRYHITLELPWSADKAVQQFGRTHRSNQVSAPEYVFLITNLAGERRFASIVAKRLESLGALTHGDRRASDNKDLSQFNIDNKYGKSALETVMKAIVGRESPIIPPPKDYKGNFFQDVIEALIGVGLIVRDGHSLTLEKDYNNISKFLNRILGMPVDLQNRLFKYFTDTMNYIIGMAKRNGTFDLGILDLGANDKDTIRKVQTITFMYRHATGIAPIQLHKLIVEKGMSWKDAMQKYEEVTDEREGFFESHQEINGKRYVILLTKVESARSSLNRDNENLKFTMYRPNTGRQNKHVTIPDIQLKYRKVEPEDVKHLWIEQYNSTICTHKYWNGVCNSGANCESGLRRKTYHVLAGAVLPIWLKIEAAITENSSMRSHKNKMQVIRLKTSDNMKIVGTLIKNNLVEGLINVLKKEAEKFEKEDFPDA